MDLTAATICPTVCVYIYIWSMFKYDVNVAHDLLGGNRELTAWHVLGFVTTTGRHGFVGQRKARHRWSRSPVVSTRRCIREAQKHQSRVYGGVELLRSSAEVLVASDMADY